MKMHSKLSLLTAFASVLVFSGCTRTVETTVPVYREVIAEIPANPNPPGVVEYIWEEPMVDVVTVPPGLDPEGHYYRPAHQEIVEIRQGRWRTYNPNQEEASK